MKKRFLILFLIMAPLALIAQNENTAIDDPPLANFQLEELVSQMRKEDKAWLPFMQGQNVLTGLYRLKAGVKDKQRPHDTDEVYYVVSGKGKFKVNEETVEVKQGSILFVKAEAEHRFFDIEEDLILVVFFDQ